MESVGKLLLAAALVFGVLGFGALVLAKLGVDRVPATFTWRSDKVTVFLPIGLMILVSVIGTIVLNIFFRR